MFCPKCGRELEATARFCQSCGTAVRPDGGGAPGQESTAAPAAPQVPAGQGGAPAQKPKKAFRRGVVLAGIAAVVLLAVCLLLPKGRDIEYSNNGGDKLPIVVTGIEIGPGNLYTEPTTTFYLENREDVDYRHAQFAVLAWDSGGFPIPLDQPFVVSDADYFHDYLEFFQVDNIPSRASLSCACVFNFDVAEVASMAVFLISCEDFAGDTWGNPIAEDGGELEGCKLEDTDLYYFEFSME